MYIKCYEFTSEPSWPYLVNFNSQFLTPKLGCICSFHLSFNPRITEMPWDVVLQHSSV